MDTKVIKNTKEYSIEQVEKDPDDVGCSYLGKIINKSNRKLLFKIATYNNDECYCVMPKSELTILNNSRDYEKWEYILEDKYEVWMTEDLLKPANRVVANKEIQEALNYMFGCAMTKDNITDYEEKKMIECSDIIKQAIDDLELYKSLLNSPDTKPNNDDDVIECICLVREIHTKKVMLEVCDWCYGEWDIANNFELLGWTSCYKCLCIDL